MMVRALAAVVALSLCTGAADADRVWMTNGNYLEGSAVVLPDGQVEIRSSFGTMTLPAEKVVRIETTETVEQEVERALAAIPLGDAEAVFELALWCESRGAHTLARRLLREVLARDPDHEAAREALGYRRFEERWVTDEEWHELRGEVYFRGEWMSREDRARIVQLETLEARADVERQRERARLAQLRYEVELTHRAAGPPAHGIPYLPWGYGAGAVLVPSAVVVPPKLAPRHEPSPAVRPSPHRAAPRPSPARPAPPPPRHHRGRFAAPQR